MGAETSPGNPHEGHTLKSALQQVSKSFEFEPEMAGIELLIRHCKSEIAINCVPLRK